MRLDRHFYTQDALDVAPNILGKTIVRTFPDGTVFKDVITEVEVYRGEEDLAAHVSKGNTERTKINYGEGGFVYIYLIYGMYWLLNIVTGTKDQPQSILIRGLKNVEGPGRVGKMLKLDKSFYGEDLVTSSRLWLEDTDLLTPIVYETTPRIGVEYAKEWAKNPWRYVLKIS